MLSAHNRIIPARIPELDVPEWNALYLELYSNAKKCALAPEFLELFNFVNLKASGIILDIACGFGLFTQSLAEHFPDCAVIGLDNNVAMVERARTLNTEIKNLSFTQGNVYDLSRFQNQCSLITCHDALHHFNELELAVNQIYMALKNNSVFWFCDVNRETASNAVFKWMCDISRSKSDSALSVCVVSYRAAYLYSEINTCLKNNGFNVKRIGEYDTDICKEYYGVATKKL